MYQMSGIRYQVSGIHAALRAGGGGKTTRPNILAAAKPPVTFSDP
jgi:hypothetical protein